ncbi:unnamed protein product [Schistocephalus solidus]|uniref:UBR-type domain-containing protein n=1 Tax=Schistocephalus solidus TaxID=70667 RepID=A0A3P7BUD6_SCHSO|nr:unnamed protein product [Schistocephalus solidus]
MNVRNPNAMAFVLLDKSIGALRGIFGMSDDPVLTIDEYISSSSDENAIILGGVDGEETCSFTRVCCLFNFRGYLKRQAVYCCKTCLDITGKVAGICFQCSLICHNEHEITELYTKRNFRCDCGNSRFKDAAPCQLWEEKDDLNVNNRYDQTFGGLFCTCSRPYPDPDAEDEPEMFQCGICEDWFHLNHIGLPEGFKPDESYEELTCPACVERLPLLWLYHFENSQKRSELPDASIDASISQAAVEERPSKRLRLSSEENTCLLSNVRQACSCSAENPTRDHLSKLAVNGAHFPSPIFWPSNWRTLILCHCDQCKELYKSLNIGFLMDPEDTIAHYMEVGRVRVNQMDSEYNSAISTALSELPHPAAVTVARGISKLKSAIEDFLTQHREKGHVSLFFCLFLLL